MQAPMYGKTDRRDVQNNYLDWGEPLKFDFFCSSPVLFVLCAEALEQNLYSVCRLISEFFHVILLRD